ncbi:MAG TPA: TolC family protein [Ramlibacter sp.]|nr:TolC family protein [Ramlibacter sp.]
MQLRSSMALACALACAGPSLALTFPEAMSLAEQQSPALQVQGSALSAAQASRTAAGALPDPRLSLGVDNLPISGMDRYSLTRDFMTMQRIGLMQEVPNRAKRDARVQQADARAARERALLTVARLQLRQSLVRTWLAVRFNGERQRVLDDLVQENRRLQDTLTPRIAAGTAQASDLLMARQEALALADRGDELAKEEAKARAALRRYVGVRAGEPLQGEAPLSARTPAQIRDQLHGHAELAVYGPMQDMAQAELREAQAETRGDWSWEVAYSRRGSQWGDMVSFQLNFDLPWQQARRQQPLIAARQNDAQRIAAERLELQRRHEQEVEEQIAEMMALERQRERAQASGLRLAQERVSLALAGYQSNRENLGTVLAARRELLEARLRIVDLDAQHADLRARLDNLIAE